jgi:phosphoglycolate phosphatase
MTRYREIVFDLDGTLVDSLPGIDYSFRAAISEVCPGIEIPDLRAFIGPPITEVFRQVLVIEDAFALERLTRAFRSSYDTNGWKQTRLYPGALDCLSDLQSLGCIIHLLTNKPLQATQQILQLFNLAQYLRSTVAPSPSSGPLSKVQLALDQKQSHKIKAQVTLLIGDSRDDAEAASVAGYNFAAVTYGYGEAARQNRYKISHTINRLNELPSLVRG